MHFNCKMSCHCTCYISQHFPCVCLCAVLLMYVWSSSMTPNEDLWPWVKHTIQLPCCRNACFFTHSFLSLSFFIIVCYSFGHSFTKSVVFSTFLSIPSFSLFLSCQHAYLVVWTCEFGQSITCILY